MANTCVFHSYRSSELRYRYFSEQISSAVIIRGLFLTSRKNDPEICKIRHLALKKSLILPAKRAEIIHSALESL